jgi:HSP20 family protein
VRSRTQTLVFTSEVGEFADEARLALEQIRGTLDTPPVGECAPAVDVFETDDAIEITIDLPAVPAECVRVIVKGAGVLIVGEKLPRRRWSGASFHLVERGFGRFARLVRLTSPCDTSRAGAVLANGELRVTFPKRPERRGQTRQVPVVSTSSTTRAESA